MSWTCTKCNRSFLHINQQHSCLQIDINQHFLNKRMEVAEAFNILCERVRTFGDIQISPVKNAILFSSGSTFLAVKPKTNWLDIEFPLEEKVEEFPIYKCIQASKKKFVHFIKIENKSEIDKQLIDWLFISFQLCNK